MRRVWEGGFPEEDVMGGFYKGVYEGIYEGVKWGVKWGASFSSIGSVDMCKLKSFDVVVFFSL